MDSWGVYIRGPDRERLFRLKRKASRAALAYQQWHNVRRLVSIELNGVAEVGCFQVDNPDGLFITRDFVVTHNTDGMLGKWAIKEQAYGKAFNAVMFRRTTVSSEDAIERSKDIYRPLGGKLNETKLVWRMPHGGRVAFAYLDSIKDADEYQGRNVTDAWVEEVGQYPDPAPIDRLFGVLRSASGVPVQMVVTGNPGGAGQHWVAARYQLIPFPDRPKIIVKKLANGAEHKIAVIPGRITDNRVLLDSDPGYINRLHLVGSQALVRAWLDGDWTAIEGAFFDEWSPSKHVVSPFEVPAEWARFRSMDWGSAAPFSVGWWAIAADATAHDGHTIPRGALVRYREWYGASGPGKGLKLSAQEVADGIKLREAGEKISYGVLDPAAFAEDGGPSIAERLAQRGVFFRPADNKRVSQRGAMGGWDIMRARLKGQDGVPMLYVFSTCRDFIRTVPVLQHDQARPEDLDTSAEDHAADEARYGCMSRPWSPSLPEPKRAPRDRYEPRETETDWKTV